LGDPAVLLAACERLVKQQNTLPSLVAKQGAKLYEWLSEGQCHPGLDGETVRHLTGSVALAVMTAQRHLGRSREWTGWFHRASVKLAGTVGSAPSLGLLEFERLARLYGSRCYQTVADQVGVLIDRFKQLSMDRNVGKTRFLQALSLKDLGRNSDAIACLRRAQEDALACGDDLTVSLCVTHMAQLYGIAGQFERAIAHARAAAPLAAHSGCLWALGDVEGTIGELLRDQGDYVSAVVAYRSAIARYDELEMESMAAYLRVVLAQTMLLAGQQDEAVAEILKALPIIEREKLSHEAAVAVALLHEAIRRGQPNPEALRELREQLTRMKEEGRL
jgi:tetratricopeptide (TPR) repeat protein